MDTHDGAVAVRAACERGDYDAATTAIIREFGPEILGFIHAAANDETRADEAFSAFCAGVWRSLPGFGWRSSLRTWLYTIARRSLADRHREATRRAAREVALSRAPALAAAEVRTTTLPHLRTTVKREVRALRAQLAPEDRALLVLRVDREMKWREIAEVMAEPRAFDPGDDRAGLDRAAARLRKRFERVVARLGELARDANL